MSAALVFGRDEDGSLTCPLTTHERVLLADDEVETQQRVCGAVVNLAMESQADLVGFLGAGLVDPFDGWAAHGRWKVECEEGHVLATSQYDGPDGYDVARFDIDWLPIEVPS